MNKQPLFTGDQWRSLNDHMGLTNRWLQLVQIISEGYSPKEAASIMGISPKTVEAHLLRIYQHLQVSGLQELLIHIFCVYLTTIGDE